MFPLYDSSLLKPFQKSVPSNPSSLLFFSAWLRCVLSVVLRSLHLAGRPLGVRSAIIFVTLDSDRAGAQQTVWITECVSPHVSATTADDHIWFPGRHRCSSQLSLCLLSSVCTQREREREIFKMIAIFSVATWVALTLDLTAFYFLIHKHILVIWPVFKTDVMSETKPFCFEGLQVIPQSGKS